MPNFSIDPAPAAYWFWHSIPEPEKIRQQLREMHTAGIKTFLIQARSAMPLEDYLSDGYFAAYRTAMQEARTLGMIAGIYDDYNWDSGQAGGRTVKLNPNARERHLFWSVGQIKGTHCDLTVSGIHSLMYSSMGDGILNWIYETGKPEWGEWQLFKALAIRPGFSGNFDDDVVDLSPYTSICAAGTDGCRVQVDLPQGLNLEGWKIITWVAGRCVTSRLINYLSADAVNSFILAGYEPYKKAVGDYFGDPIQFVFFDHPYDGFYGWNEHCGEIGNSLMFDEGLVTAFYNRYSYPIEEALLSFIEDSGKASPQLRSDFFDLYGSLGRETFFGALSRWTKANGLALSGHEMLAHVGAWGFTEGFSFLDPRTNFGADYFAIDRYRDQTAVDASNFHPQISAKIGDSVAKANGRRGCRLEQYAVSVDPGVPGGAGQWGLTLDELRSQAIRHTFFGASEFIFHAYYQTDGKPGDLTLYKNPRFDFAPGINYEPWFEKYSLFASENKALVELIQHSEPQAKIAVLFPLLTWWAENFGHKFSDHCGHWFRFLLENHFPFDLISQDQLDSAGVENGCLKIGNEAYKTLIFPAVTTLNSAATLEQIRALISSGGRLIVSGEIPSATRAAGRDADLQRAFEQMMHSSARVRYFEKLPTDVKLVEELAALGVQTVEISNPQNQKIWSWQGSRDGKPVILLFNDSLQAGCVKLWIKNLEAQPYRVDIQTGEETPWAWYEQSEDGLTIYADMNERALWGFSLHKEKRTEPHLIQSSARISGMQMLQFGRFEIALEISASEKAECLLESIRKPEVVDHAGVNVEILPVKPAVWKATFTHAKCPHSVRLSNWTLSIPGMRMPFPVELSSGWEQQGFADFAGEGIYHCDFTLPDLADELVPVLTLPRVETTAEVWLNGKILGEAGWPPYQWRIPDTLLATGENQIEIRVRNSAANRYYAGTPFQPGGKQPSGLIGYPVIHFYRQIKLICSEREEE